MKLAVESLQFPHRALHAPGWYAGAIILAALGQGVIRIFSRTTLLHAARRIEYRIREDLYARLLALDLPWFDQKRTGDILSRFANDLTNVRMLLGFGVLNIINTVVVYIAALALMLRISPFLTLCAVVPFPLMILAVKRLSASMFRRSRRAQEELARLSSQVEENVSAMTVVKAYCREEAQIEAFGETSSRYLDCNMGMAILRGAMIPIMAGAGAIGTLIILLLGGERVIAGVLTLGDFVAFSGYLAMLVWPTIIMGWILNLMQRGAASMARLNEVLDAQPTVREPAEPGTGAAIRGAIEFRSLSFSYGSVTVLDDISLAIPAGARIGIVGPVGSGKSTLVRLIPRLYPTPDGHIFIDGTDINRLSIRELREAIGFVPQESFLFSRTLGENIGIGRGGANLTEIHTATRLASLANEVARFPHGYETLVGERGVTLSGGQRQRAAIARALLKDPAILILDDPLSAVDARTEEEILSGLATFYGNRTVLIVSHRLSAVRACDLIVVLDSGRIAEQGSHGELLARDGLYAAMWREQQLREEIERY
jgi:ATP-binding cassette subfamily B protein